MGNKKAWIIAAFFGLLRMAIVIYVIIHVWASNVDIIIQIMMFFVFLRFIRETWFKGIDNVSKWLIERIEGKVKRKPIEIGFAAMAKQQRKALEEQQKEIRVKIKELKKEENEGVVL